MPRGKNWCCCQGKQWAVWVGAMEEATGPPGRARAGLPACCPSCAHVLALAVASTSSTHLPPPCSVSRASEHHRWQGSLGRADECVCLGRWLCGAGECHSVGHMALACPATIRDISEVVLFGSGRMARKVVLLCAVYSTHFFPFPADRLTPCEQSHPQEPMCIIFFKFDPHPVSRNAYR